MLRTKVKASGINSLTDARYFAARGAHWLGYRLDPGTEGAPSQAAVAAIKEWVDGVRSIGEFEYSPPAQILDIQAELGLDGIQAGHFIAPENLVLPLGHEMIREIVVERETSAEALLRQVQSEAAHCQFFSLNFRKSDISWEDLKAGMPLSVETLREICSAHPVLVDMDFAPTQLQEALDLLPLEGICLSAGVEEKTGLKSFEQLDEIFDLLEWG